MNIATFVSGRLFRTAHKYARRMKKIFYAAALPVLMLALAACRSEMKKITVKDYPVARMDSTVDDYFGKMCIRDRGVSVVEITQPETAVVLRRASDQRAVALDFRMRADTQSAHEARVDEKVVVTARLELDQQRNVHIGGEKLRFGEFDPLFDVLVVGNGYALFVLAVSYTHLRPAGRSAGCGSSP